VESGQLLASFQSFEAGGVVVEVDTGYNSQSLPPAHMTS
jgi:hypothetical protein